MRLILLVTLTMVAFAANSVLTRLALAEGALGAAAFAATRVTAGALVLAALASRRCGIARPRPAAAAALALYMLGFTFAYLALDTGIGALILFGGVQLTMFGGAVLARERVPPRRWIGAAIAFAGLVVLLRPAGVAGGDLRWAAAMTAAAIGWGIYSLIGRGARDPLAETAANFALAVPLVLIPAGAAVLVGGVGPLTGTGVALAIVSGGATSSLGYALWYSVLPRLARANAALAQLSVPVLAALGGLVLLGEMPGAGLVTASALVIGGIALGLWPARPPRA